MKPCEALLDELDAVVAGTLPEELARHLADCPDCQLAVERVRSLSESERVVGSVRAPESLRQGIKRLPRLPLACEQAIERMGAALEGGLPAEERNALMEHMHFCQSCQAVWEAFATLRDVGASTRAPGRLKAALVLPPRQHLEARQRRGRFFDLRLATAAAYLVAALTVMMLSNPATVARESTGRMNLAATYATAVVQNRFESYSQRVADAAAGAQGWVREHAQQAWRKVRLVFGGKSANSQGKKTVVRDGGRS
jgi:predicted anti-sigma-YlaC factor YlaD